MRQNETEEQKVTLTLAGEVYYFTIAAFVTIFIICSMLSNNASILEALALIFAIWGLPFVVVAIINFTKFIFIKNLAARYGKKE